MTLEQFTKSTISDELLLSALSNHDCIQPYKLPDTGQFVRCGSRDASICPNCAKLYARDVSAILRSGIFDAPADSSSFSFLFLTLTAPSFGPTHRVPGPSSETYLSCQCGKTHGANAQHLRGIPLDIDSYDYDSAVIWNNSVGELWDSTRHRLERELGSFDFAVAREWQMRGALHLHVLIRLERFAIPAVVAHVAQAATAHSISGVEVGWGEQVDCQSLTPADESRAESAARTIWYLGKALGYSLKSLGKSGLTTKSAIGIVHLKRLSTAAQRISCGADGCVLGRKGNARCREAPHRAFGAASRPYHTSRTWSFTGLTRKRQAEARKAWAVEHGSEDAAESRFEDAQRRRRMAMDIRIDLGLAVDTDDIGTQYLRRRVDTETGEIIPPTRNMVKLDIPERPSSYNDLQWEQCNDWWRLLKPRERKHYRTVGLPPGIFHSFVGSVLIG